MPEEATYEGRALDVALNKTHAAAALLALERHGTMTGSALAEHMGPSQPITGRLMGEHLESLGLATSTAEPSPFPGQMQTVYTLTPSGRALAGLLRLALQHVPDEPRRTTP